MRAIKLAQTLLRMAAEHGDVEVVTEGCDCFGDTALVSFHETKIKKRLGDENYFLVERSRPLV